MLRTVGVSLLGALLVAGCSAAAVDFPNATPGAPRRIPASLLRPAGAGPFPAVVLMHPCHGVLPTTRRRAEWLRDLGYVALVVDSWTPRGLKENCTPASEELPNTERFDDAVGALRYLRARVDVDRDRVGVIGWSAGGVYAMALVNGPSLDRARTRGVVVPEPGFAAAVAVYPGGCFSLLNEQAVRPLLILIGAADDWTLPGPCLDMAQAMRSRGAPVDVVLYPGAVHYFDVEELPRARLPEVLNRNLPGGCCGATVGYDPGATADAKRRIAEFFGYHLRGVPAMPAPRR